MSRQPAPDDRPVTLTIAGSDSGGGAGIQADCKTMAACGAFPTSVITAVTAQNTHSVTSTHVLPVEEIDAQLSAVADDFDVAAIKTGMLATAPVIETVTEYAAAFDGPVVVDPVMISTGGDRLLDPSAIDAYEDLIAAATLVTPNSDEAGVLTDTDVQTEREARECASQLLSLGCDTVLVTGGHLQTDAVHDVLATESERSVLTRPRVETAGTHGSGCLLSSAITARLAHGDSITDAVDAATSLAGRAIRYCHDVGTGNEPVNALVGLREQALRQPLQETVADIVGTLCSDDRTRTLVPEVGMNVVGATPYAESTEEIAAVEGRITRTIDGMHPNRGVRFGASSHMARFLLSMREHDPAVRFAVNCRFTDQIEQALQALSGPIAEYDRTAEPTADKEDATMGWAASVAFEAVAGTPVAVLDRGAHGKEPIIKLLADTPTQLVDRVRTVSDRCARQ